MPFCTGISGTHQPCSDALYTSISVGTFAAAHVSAHVEVYPGTIHGWCVPDMPRHDGKPIYNKPDAERAWGKLLELYRTVLVSIPTAD